jgi:hypothetical protein
LIVFNFQGEGQPLRAYIDQVFRAAGFLEYDASEQQLVDRIVMNFHPSILVHTAFDTVISFNSMDKLYDSKK